MAQKTGELPFSARYSLPARVSENLGEVSWETVAHLSTEFQVSSEEKSSKVKRLLKELQMGRLLLMDKIRHTSRDGAIDPKLLVDVVRLLQKCEKVAVEYDVDLHEFSSFLYLVSEKLKKEKLAIHRGPRDTAHLAPIQEELYAFKDRGESSRNNRVNRDKKKPKK